MDYREEFKKSYFDEFKKLFPFLTEEKFMGYYDESVYGGYPDEPGGSVWESEGKSIYVLIRILKPKNILEIGNFLGRSANHILQAVEKNNVGDVVLLDIEERLEYDSLHNHNFKRVIKDSLEYLTGDINLDLIIQDGNHTYNHVLKEIDLILNNNMSTDYTIWGHDYYQRNNPEQCSVWKAWDEKKHLFSEFIGLKDGVSNCGFSIARIKKHEN